MRRRPFLLILAIVAFLTLLSHADHPNSHARAQAKRSRTEQPDPSKIKKYVSAQESQEIAEAFSRANNAFEKQDYKTGAENLKPAYLLNPEDDLIIDFLAESNVMVPDRYASLMWLQRLLTVSPCFFHMPENAASVLTPQEYAELARTAKAKGPVLHASRIAFTLSETDLIPEGIAYDPLDQAFFLSSLHKRKIVRVRLRAPRAPLVEDFAAPAQDGLYSTLGMKVDAERRILWVCSSAESFMQGYSDADSGKAALFKYDLNTRKLISKYELGPKPAHLLNDVVVNAEGDVFVTDTVSGDIFTVKHDRDQLEVFIPGGTFHAPNGIAISDDGRQLFISEMPLGVYAVDLKTKRSERLPQSVGISPSGSDGLYFYDGSLIGIINIVSERNGRVARFYLDGSARSISHARVLDCNHPRYQWPTTGVVVGDSLFYIANSQFGSFNSEKRTFPRESLHQVAVMKVKL
jgi:sugar lactone lactonase YvrE